MSIINLATISTTQENK
ncbi:hypothetical protein ACVXHA_18870 [Escherichia coli]|nr:MULTISPECIES: hypothetical protein [Enterobacteriaceae]